ncbi:MAG: PFL family protein [Kiritimatiellia bacterium]
MLARQDVISTIRMVREENLDVRTVTLGISLASCASREPEQLADSVYSLITEKAARQVTFCNEVSGKYGLPIVNKRIAVSPVSYLLEGHTPETAVKVCKALDAAARDVNIDLLGGYSALVQKGITAGEKTLIESLPEALASTERVCSSFNVGTTRAGINADAVKLISGEIIKTATATKGSRGFGCAKIVVFANMPEDNPFMAGAMLGAGQPECVINVGVSGPGVVKRAVERMLKKHPAATLDEIAEEIKHTAFRVTRTGELIGSEVARMLDIPFGIVDLSLAPTPRVGDSVGEIYQAMGVESIGAPGTTAAVMLLNDAVKKGGAFASSAVGGLSGAFIPVMEDHALSQAVTDGTLTLEKLEAMTAVCSVGLDMILLPGDTSAETIAGLILDEAAIGITSRKTTGVRAIPVPGAKHGEFIDFGGLFGSGTITNPVSPKGAETFVNRGGHIPAPIHSMLN